VELSIKYTEMAKVQQYNCMTLHVLHYYKTTVTEVCTWVPLHPSSPGGPLGPGGPW